MIPLEAVLSDDLQSCIRRRCAEEITTGPLAALREGAKNENMLRRVDAAIAWRAWRIWDEEILGQYCSPDVGAAVMLGRTPKSLSGGLSAREAGQWVTSDHPSPVAWLQQRLLGEHEPASPARHIEVVRWAARLLKSQVRKSTVLTDQPEGLDWGHGGRVIDRLDEIKPCDLADSAMETIGRACTRAIAEKWDGPDELAQRQPYHDDWEKHGVTPILTFTRLYEEGQVMRHCVADYAKEISRGDCTVVSVRTGEHRSTAQIDRSGRVVQHTAWRNAVPSPECTEALTQALSQSRG